MGFLRSSCSVTRFVINESLPKDFWLDIGQKLRQFSFKDIDDTLEERSWGWTNIDDMLDTDWELSPPQKGEYIAFALRLETRRIPPGVLKKHTAIALRNEQGDEPRSKGKPLHYEKKKAIVEAARNRLLKRFLPIPAVFDAAWNTSSNTVLLASTEAKVIRLFSNLFTATFNASLVRNTPYNLAKLLLDEPRGALLDQVEPIRFV